MPRHAARHAKRRDSNESEIVAALKKAGATVMKMDEIDLLVGFQGCNYLMEVKTPTGKVNEDQEAFFATWKGQISLVRNPETALSIIGIPDTDWHLYID